MSPEMLMLILYFTDFAKCAGLARHSTEDGPMHNSGGAIRIHNTPANIRSQVGREMAPRKRKASCVDIAAADTTWGTSSGEQPKRPAGSNGREQSWERVESEESGSITDVTTESLSGSTASPSRVEAASEERVSSESQNKLILPRISTRDYGWLPSSRVSPVLKAGVPNEAFAGEVSSILNELGLRQQLLGESVGELYARIRDGFKGADNGTETKKNITVIREMINTVKCAINEHVIYTRRVIGEIDFENQASIQDALSRIETKKIETAGIIAEVEFKLFTFDGLLARSHGQYVSRHGASISQLSIRFRETVHKCEYEIFALQRIVSEASSTVEPAWSRNRLCAVLLESRLAAAKEAFDHFKETHRIRVRNLQQLDRTVEQLYKAYRKCLRFLITEVCEYVCLKILSKELTTIESVGAAAGTSESKKRELSMVAANISRMHLAPKLVEMDMHIVDIQVALSSLTNSHATLPQDASQ